MQYLFLFSEGLLTFISPCLLPLLPVYISFFTAGESNKHRALINSLGFVLGFTLIYVLLGAFAGTVGKVLNEYAILINLVSGTIVIILGLSFLGVININFFGHASSNFVGKKGLSFFSALLFGIVFSVHCTHCVGTFLGAALMMASRQGGTLTGIWMLLVYSLGLGIPFVASAIFIDKLKGTFDLIKRNYKIVNLVSGLFLIIVGILMMTGQLDRFLIIF